MLLLSGCATTRYVPTPCIAKDQQIPDEPGPVKDKLTGKADEDIRVVTGSLLRWQDYGRGLREVVEQCR
jgi:hypothetical protein